MELKPKVVSLFGQYAREDNDGSTRIEGPAAIRDPAESPGLPQTMRANTTILTSAAALAAALCLALCQQVPARETAVATDRSLFDGVFAGDVSPAVPRVTETIKMYDGPLPEDRPSSFWSLYEFRNKGLKISEEDVYNCLLRHYDRHGKKDWEIAIGKGGQLYSWRGPWGEAIAPQAAPWMDEVWQATLHSPQAAQVLKAIRAYDKEQNNFTGTVGEAFVHGSGSKIRPNAYTREEAKASAGMTMFFLPRLARRYDAESKSYSMINLGQSPTQPTVLLHKILFYSRYRYVGDGAVEVTNAAYNFGDYAYGYNGIPWGGVRTTTYPELFVSDPDGSYRFFHQYFGHGSTFMRPASKTDGWLGSAAKRDDPKCQTFAFVFGRNPAGKTKQGRRKSLNCAYGRGQLDKNGKIGKRAYTVMASNTSGQMPPGQSFWVRYYLVVGTMEHVVKRARQLRNKVDYNALNLSEKQATLAPLYRKTRSDGTRSLARERSNGAKAVCRVYNEPILNSKPLFVIRELPTGRSIVTTNPYELSRRKAYRNPVPESHKLHGKLENAFQYYTHESEAGKVLAWELLGFVMPADKATGNAVRYVKLSGIVDGPGTGGMLALRCTGADGSDVNVKGLRKEE